MLAPLKDVFPQRCFIKEPFGEGFPQSFRDERDVRICRLRDDEDNDIGNENHIPQGYLESWSPARTTASLSLRVTRLPKMLRPSRHIPSSALSPARRIKSTSEDGG